MFHIKRIADTQTMWCYWQSDMQAGQKEILITQRVPAMSVGANHIK